MHAAIKLNVCPEIKIGPHCSDPYDCPLAEVCWDFVPERSVFNLRYARGKQWDLFQRGVLRLEDIPNGFTLNDAQALQVACQRSGETHVDHAAIQSFLSGLEHPLYFFDFETFMPAVPMFDISKPYGQIPFQFSLHVVERKGAKPQHFSFLAEGRDDPRPEMLQQARDLLGSKGSIVGYNVAFEKSRLNECAGFFPEYRVWVDSVTPRFFDLLVPFRAMRYYNPVQNGSASLKAVLPALTGSGYENLEIQEGGTASREFVRVTYGDVADEERARVRASLEAYCCQDTRALIDLLEALERL
jgi:hypothetical protein